MADPSSRYDDGIPERTPQDAEMARLAEAHRAAERLSGGMPRVPAPKRVPREEFQHPTRRPVLDTRTGRVYPSAMAAARAVRVCQPTISRHLNAKRAGTYRPTPGDPYDEVTRHLIWAEDAEPEPDAPRPAPRVFIPAWLAASSSHRCSSVSIRG